MLHCNMNDAAHLRLGLEDVLGDLWDARRREDLGRLALVVHCDLRRWARAAKQELLAARCQDLVLSCPQSTREAFFERIDVLIREAEKSHARLAPASVEAADTGNATEPPDQVRETSAATLG
jgi:hypothetical protein